ncbi:MAG: nucleotidyltransferase [Nitrospinae bacterium]|nr:nucleotidyltransferase [Nitrospinota bacterium]
MFEEILSRIGASLNKHNLPYMIIGGQAVLLYGEPRLTRDIDITLGVNTDYIDKIITVVQELFLKPIPTDIKSFVRQTMVLPTLDETTGIRVDFIFSFTPYETSAIKRVKKIRVMGEDVHFASQEDIIIHKIFAGRPRDIEDIRTIVMKNPSMDFQYIRKWLKEFDASSDKKDFLNTFEDILKGLE